MTVIYKLLLTISLLNNTPTYKVLHEGRIYECHSYQYNDVGCIQFIEIYSEQEIKFCNNFLLIPQCI
jgi:hypothetical protein